jgi:hypothetical protein
MPKSKTPVIIMAFIMVAVGIALSQCLSLLATEKRPVTPVAPTVAPTMASLTTISVLFIGVDSCTDPNPTLESLTVVKYQTEVAKYFLLAVSPDTATGPVSATVPMKTIRSYYAEDAPLQRQALVTQAALRKISPQLGGIYAEVDFDRQTITETIGLLEPFECLGQTQTGEEVLRRFDALAPDAAEERLHFQGNLLQCLFVAARKQNWSFPKLMDSLGERFYPSRDLATITLEAAPPLPQSEFTVNYLPLNPFEKATPQP